MKVSSRSITASVNFADENLPFRAETNFNNTELAPFIALVRPPTRRCPITGQATGRVFLEGNLSGDERDDGKRGFTTENLRGSAEFSQLALQIGETPLMATEPVSVRFNAKRSRRRQREIFRRRLKHRRQRHESVERRRHQNLTVDGAINLSVFNALSQNTFFAGIANVSVRLTGAHADARLNGTAELQNASVAAFIGSERLTFDRINGRVLFTSNQAQIERLIGFFGGGRVIASGGALLEGLQLQAFPVSMLRGNNFTAPLPQDFITTGDAEIEISGERRGEHIRNADCRKNHRQTRYL